MTTLDCPPIRRALDELRSLHGWEGYTYTFAQTHNWMDPRTTLVRVASQALRTFLALYERSDIRYTKMEMSILKNDFPQTFVVKDFDHIPSDRRLVELYQQLGWRSGLGFPCFGYGGVLGLVVLYSREAQVPSELAEMSASRLCPLTPQLNHWARETLTRDIFARCKRLSTREMECMMLVAEGMTSKEVARILHITKRTADFHIHNATEKMGGLSRSEAALQFSLVSLPQLRHFGTRAVRPQPLA